MRKLLVTGGKGLVGSAIRADVKLGREFDLTRSEQAQLALATHKPTHIIHCAGKIGGLGGNMNHKGEYFHDNLMINTNVIEGARLAGVTNLIAFLSTCVFPDGIAYPLTESKIHLGEPHFSNYPYAYSKRMAEVQIRAYREQYGLRYSSVIPCNVYGPNDNFSLTHGHVIPMLIHKIHHAQRDGGELLVWGDGSPLREFIHSTDVARLAEWAVDNYDEAEPIILSPAEEISIGDLVGLLVAAFNFKGNVKFDRTKPNGQHRKPSDNSKLKSYLPDFKFTPIEVGIEETVKWFIENYENARK